MIYAITLCLLIFAIVFTQSGLDKVLNYASEKAFVEKHLAKSLLKPVLPLLFPTITLLEVSAGIISLLAIFEIFFLGGFRLTYLSGVLVASSLLSLLLGQRLAKDYAGAQTIVIYLIPVILFFTLLEFAQ